MRLRPNGRIRKAIDAFCDAIDEFRDAIGAFRDTIDAKSHFGDASVLIGHLLLEIKVRRSKVEVRSSSRAL